jgi:hypothetical protein
LDAEREFPLQQFYLIPYGWFYLAQRRRIVAPESHSRRSWPTMLYRAYWFLWIDLGLHVLIKLLIAVPRSRSFIRFFYRHVLSGLIIKNRRVVDASDKMLVMEHELFKHLEIEIFVPAVHVREAAEFARIVVAVFDGEAAAIPEEVASGLKRIGMYEALFEMRGSFTQHYPITFRRVLADDALISMSCGADAPYWALSFITYAEPRDRFLVLAALLARSMTALFRARLHWGKYFPLTNGEIESEYPHMEEFRRICRRVDPRGVFRNEYVDRVLGFSDRSSHLDNE